MDLDIEKIRSDLEKENQVVAAQVRRKFPDTLKFFCRNRLHHGASVESQIRWI